eukprot:76742-Rhodomonas_salina.2
MECTSVQTRMGPRASAVTTSSWAELLRKSLGVAVEAQSQEPVLVALEQPRAEQPGAAAVEQASAAQMEAESSPPKPRKSKAPPQHQASHPVRRVMAQSTMQGLLPTTDPGFRVYMKQRSRLLARHCGFQVVHVSGALNACLRLCFAQIAPTRTWEEWRDVVCEAWL